MSPSEFYNLILCLIVFTCLTVLFSVLITWLIKLNLRVIRAGIEDHKIEEEYNKKLNKKQSHVGKILDVGFPMLVCIILFVTLCFSMYSRFTSNQKVGAIPTVKVVNTGSMEYKNKANSYLVENGLDDQIKTFDLIVLRELPKEEDLELYDIVVYETNGYDIVHRIVGIEEPNDEHPEERWFVLRGDANIYTDEFPVTYDQMKSIYRGERVPFVGTFVQFMQSPAGMLCFLLVVFAVIATPIAEKKFQIAKDERIEIIKQAKLDKEKGIIVKAFLITDKDEFDASIKLERENGGSPVSFERIKRVAEMGIEQEDETAKETEKENQTNRSKIKTH